MFNTLKTNGEFDYFNLKNGEKTKIEGIWIVRTENEIPQQHHPNFSKCEIRTFCYY